MKKIILAPFYITYSLALIVGNYFYYDESYDSAVNYYDIASKHPDGDSMHAEYNKASALYQQGSYDSSSETLKNVIEKTEEDNLKQKSYYNLGNNYYRLGEARIKSGKYAEGVSYWMRAIDEYRNSLKIDPEDAQAKENIKFIEELLKQAYIEMANNNTVTPTPSSKDTIQQNEIQKIKEKEIENLKNYKIESQMRNYNLSFEKEDKYW